MSLYRAYHRLADTYLNHVRASETLVSNQKKKNSSGRPERLERDGPCLLLKLRVNGDSKSTHERNRSLVCSLGL